MEQKESSNPTTKKGFFLGLGSKKSTKTSGKDKRVQVRSAMTRSQSADGREKKTRQTNVLSPSARKGNLKKARSHKKELAEKPSAAKAGSGDSKFGDLDDLMRRTQELVISVSSGMHDWDRNSLEPDSPRDNSDSELQDKDKDKDKNGAAGHRKHHAHHKRAVSAMPDLDFSSLASVPGSLVVKSPTAGSGGSRTPRRGHDRTNSATVTLSGNFSPMIKLEKCELPNCDAKAVKIGMCAHHALISSIRHDKDFCVTFVLPPDPDPKDVKTEQVLRKFFQEHIDKKTQKMDKSRWELTIETSGLCMNTELRKMDVELTFGLIKPLDSKMLSFEHFCRGLNLLAHRLHNEDDDVIPLRELLAKSLKLKYKQYA